MFHDISIPDFVLALITLILCLYVGCTMVVWRLRLRWSKTLLKPFIVSVVIFKFALASWAFGNSYAIFYGDHPPWITLLPRIAILVAILIQTRVIYRMKEAERK